MHIFLIPPVLTECQKCGKPVRPHTVCFHCGYYQGREVIDVLKRLTKKERKQREREIKQKEKEVSREKPLSWEELSRK